MLNKVINEKLFHAVGQVGFFPCNSSGDDILVYRTDCGSKNVVKETLHGMRQQVRCLERLFCKLCFYFSVQ